MALLPLVGMSLRTRGYKKTLDWLDRRLQSQSASEPAAGTPLELVQRTCRMLRAAEQHGLVRSTCLEESLTLWYLLGQQDITSRLRIGVRKRNETFEAHAWVEYDGEALNPSGELHQHYAAFECEFPSVPTEKP